MQNWDLPSFDATPQEATVPTVDAMQNIHAKAHQEGFARGLQEGVVEGQKQGLELGHQEGLELGRKQGFEAGYQQGYDSGLNDLKNHLQGLRSVLNTLSELPHDIESALTSWVYETALRLSGQSSLDRNSFASAVQEALMRLPRPGEQLFVRVSPADMVAWSQLATESSSFVSVLQPDPELQAGQAFVEIGGTTLDLGVHARRALVKSALGLLETESAPPPSR
jgi:flagellar assembly protein FliH